MSMRHRFGIVTAFALFAVQTALAQPYAPVVHVTELTDESRGRTMEVWIWGPGSPMRTDDLVAGNSVFQPVGGRYGRDIVAGRHPLLVFFHGTSGNARSIAWLSAALAGHGYMVVSANHPGSTSLQVTEESMLHTWWQAEDGHFLIDALLTSEGFRDVVDPDRIGSIGFSLGGYSALAIAGVRLRIQELQSFCRTHAGEETCKLFPEALYSPLVDGAPQNRDVTHPRIRAAVSLAPGYVPAMTEESLIAMQTPALVLAGSEDEMLPIGHHARALAGRLKFGEYIELSYASHFSFLGECTSGALEILREESAEFLCDDPEGVERSAIHGRVIRHVVGFFDSTLR